MGKVVELSDKRDRGRRKLGEYVTENCESWDSCIIVACTKDSGINVVTSNDDGVEFIGMIEIAKTMLIKGVVDE